tara:strand:- start:1650 stop:2036 length:387 start_codon:yes stop_codon:yes gene_type:complete
MPELMFVRLGVLPILFDAVVMPFNQSVLGADLTLLMSAISLIDSAPFVISSLEPAIVEGPLRGFNFGTHLSTSCIAAMAVPRAKIAPRQQVVRLWTLPLAKMTGERSRFSRTKNGLPNHPPPVGASNE